MNLKIKALLTVLLILVTLTCVTGCAQEADPYELNDAESYNVSVKYDANGGFFTTNTSVIVDSYNISGMAQNGGKAEIALLSPDSSLRGNDAFTAINNGYFLAGWYAECTETTDETGSTVYTYGKKWDFEKDRLEVDAAGTYTSSEPVLTLYAAWVPLFEIQFCDLKTGEHLSTYTFNPTTEGDILVPDWSEETGTIEMYRFPEKEGYTFNAAFYDAEGTQFAWGSVEHPGEVNYETGTAENVSMQLYVDWVEGNWYHIYNAQQFLDNASVSGCYVLYADLDFEGLIWPSSLMYGNFTGHIQADFHTMKNIQVTQTNNSKVNAGLFGHLTEEAKIFDLNLENVTFTIQKGTRMAGTNYGLLAGSISSEAMVVNVTIKNSTLAIDSGSYFGTDDYVIGLICGMGSTDIDASGITCTVVGDAPDTLWAIVNDGMVTLSDEPVEETVSPVEETVPEETAETEA